MVLHPQVRHQMSHSCTVTKQLVQLVQAPLEVWVPLQQCHAVQEADIAVSAAVSIVEFQTHHLHTPTAFPPRRYRLKHPKYSDHIIKKRSHTTSTPKTKQPMLGTMKTDMVAQATSRSSETSKLDGTHGSKEYQPFHNKDKVVSQRISKIPQKTAFQASWGWFERLHYHLSLYPTYRLGHQAMPFFYFLLRYNDLSKRISLQHTTVI